MSGIKIGLRTRRRREAGAAERMALVAMGQALLPRSSGAGRLLLADGGRADEAAVKIPKSSRKVNDH